MHVSHGLTDGQNYLSLLQNLNLSSFLRASWFFQKNSGFFSDLIFWKYFVYCKILSQCITLLVCI